MAVSIDQNGIPTLVGESDGMLDGESASILESPEQPQVTFASLVRGFLDVAAAAASVIIDPVLRRFRGEDNVVQTELLAATKSITLAPDAGQTGRSLAWSVTASAGGPTQALIDALTGTVAAVKPRMTVESLTARILDAIPVALQDKVMVSIDQTDGNIKIWESATAGARVTDSNAVWDEALATAPDRSIKITLSEPQTEGSAANLVFEGGSTS